MLFFSVWLKDELEDATPEVSLSRSLNLASTTWAVRMSSQPWQHAFGVVLVGARKPCDPLLRLDLVEAHRAQIGPGARPLKRNTVTPSLREFSSDYPRCDIASRRGKRRDLFYI